MLSGGGCFEEASGVGVPSPVGRSGELPQGNGVLSRAAWLPDLLGSGSWCVSGARRKGWQLCFCCSGLSTASLAAGLAQAL